MSSPSTIEVALALIWRQNHLLITRRPAETHLGGMWEFPGGKVGPEETVEACAEREAREEVGVTCRAVARREPIRFTYPERTVCLYPVDCEYTGGAPQALEVAEWAWVHPAELGRYEFPPANAGLLASLGAVQRD